MFGLQYVVKHSGVITTSIFDISLFCMQMVSVVNVLKCLLLFVILFYRCVAYMHVILHRQQYFSDAEGSNFSGQNSFKTHWWVLL